MQKTLLTEEQEQELIDYYKNHCNQNVTKKFHIGLSRLYDILKKYNVSPHTKEETKILHNIAREESLIKKYGVKNISQIEEVKNKKLNKLEESKIKRRNTLINRYGKLGTFNQEKCKNTIKERYGVSNISQLEYIKQKKKDTLIKHWGSLYNAYSCRNEKSKQKCISKFGIDNFLKDPYLHAIAIEKGLQAKLKMELYV